MQRRMQAQSSTVRVDPSPRRSSSTGRMSPFPADAPEGNTTGSSARPPRSQSWMARCLKLAAPPPSGREIGEDSTSIDVKIGRVQRIDGSPEWYRRVSLHPHSHARAIWDTVAMLFLVYNAFMVPMRLCFDVTDYCPEPLWVFDSVTDWFFVCDLVLNFFTAVIREEDMASAGVAASTPAQAYPGLVAREYIRSWFFLDLAASAPIDFISSIST